MTEIQHPDTDPKEIVREILTTLEALEAAPAIPTTVVDVDRERIRRLASLVHQITVLHQAATSDGSDNLFQTLERLYRESVRETRRKLESLKLEIKRNRDQLAEELAQLDREKRAYDEDEEARRDLITEAILEALLNDEGLDSDLVTESKTALGALHTSPEVRSATNAALPDLLPHESTNTAYPATKLLISGETIDVESQKGQFRTGDILRVVDRSDARYGRLFVCEGFTKSGYLYVTEITTSGLAGAPFRFAEKLTRLRVLMSWGSYEPADFNFYPDRDRPGVKATFRKQSLLQAPRQIDVVNDGFPRGEAIEIYCEWDSGRTTTLDTTADTFGFRGGDLIVARRSGLKLSNGEAYERNPFGVVLGYEEHYDGSSIVCWVTIITRKNGRIDHTIRIKDGEQGQHQYETVAKWGEYDPSDYGFDVDQNFRMYRGR